MQEMRDTKNNRQDYQCPSQPFLSRHVTPLLEKSVAWWDKNGCEGDYVQDYWIARKFGSLDGIEESYWGPSKVNKLRAFLNAFKNIHISWIAPHICHKLIFSSQVSVRRIVNVLLGNSVPCASDFAIWLFVRPKSAVIFTIPVKVSTVVAWYV